MTQIQHEHSPHGTSVRGHAHGTSVRGHAHRDDDKDATRATFITMAIVFAIVIGLGLLLSGCAQTKYVATPEPFCAAVKTLCVSKDDKITDDTASDMEANNLGRAKICKKRPEDDCKKNPRNKSDLPSGSVPTGPPSGSVPTGPPSGPIPKGQPKTS